MSISFQTLSGVRSPVTKNRSRAMMPSCRRLVAEPTAYDPHMVQLRARRCTWSGTGLSTASWVMPRQFFLRQAWSTRGRAAAFVAGCSLGSKDPLRGWSLGEQPCTKRGYQRSTLLARQPVRSRSWSSGDQHPCGNGPQGVNFARQLVPT